MKKLRTSANKKAAFKGSFLIIQTVFALFLDWSATKAYTDLYTNVIVRRG